MSMEVRLDQMDAAAVAVWLMWGLEHWPQDDAAIDGHRRALFWAAAALERHLAGEDGGRLQ